MALSEIDRQLIQRCLEDRPRAWEDFVDRFMGLVVHVVNHSAQCRSLRLSNSDREDLVADVFLAIIDKDYAVLRRFRGSSSLATYLSVIARRVVVAKLLTTMSGIAHNAMAGSSTMTAIPAAPEPDQLATQEEVDQLLNRLDGPESDVIRLYYKEGRTYREISDATGMPENSIGPLLSRARNKMRSSAGVE